MRFLALSIFIAALVAHSNSAFANAEMGSEVPRAGAAGDSRDGAAGAEGLPLEPSEAVEIVRAEDIVVVTLAVDPAEVYLDMPVETEVFTAEDLRVLPGTNAIDALDAIPGIRITSQVQGQRGAVRIDGLPPEFTEILVNGQRYSGENGDAIDLGDVLFANIDRIEIIRGPQALRYSARAAGGVINIITKAPPVDGVRVSGESAGGDQEQALFEASVGWGTEKLGIELTYDFNQAGGFNSPNSGSTDPDDGLASPFGEGSLFRTHDAYATLRANPNESVRLMTRLGYRLRDDGFAVNDGPVESRRETDRWLFSQDARVSISDLTEMYGTFTYSSEDSTSTVGRDVQITDELARLEFGLTHSREIGKTFHLFSAGLDLATVGIEVKEGALPDNIDNPDLELPDVEERFARGGAFAILESEWTPWLESELGVRYEMRENFKPTLLPQAAILLRPWQWDEERGIKLRFSIGQAVRYPTLRDLFQPPVPQDAGYFLAGSEDVDAERAWATRFGIEANPKRWITGSIVGFYSETIDRIRAFDQGESVSIGNNIRPPNQQLCDLGVVEFCTERITPILSSIFQNKNIDDVTSYGIEFRLDFRPAKWVDLSLGYTWNRTQVDDSNIEIDELPNSPRHIANGRLKLTAPVWDTVLTVRGQWRDRAIVEGSGTGLLSFALDAESDTSIDLDFRLLQPLEKLVGYPIDFFADLQNATDNRVVDSNVVRGRSFLMGLKWNFE